MGLLEPGGRVFFVDEGLHDGWREDWIDREAGIVNRPLTDGSVHRAVKVLWRPEDLELRLGELGWDASVTSSGPFYWGSARPFLSIDPDTCGETLEVPDSCIHNYPWYHRSMPAITVDDITVLPRIPAPDPSLALERAVASVTIAPRGFEGEGFPVRRAFHGVDLRALDPFIHMDQMGEVEYAPGEPKGTPWHPHRGFETVTYMMDGTFEHSDSNGGGGVITNGDTQWMTAGAGILHIEKPPEALVVSGGLFHGIQLWVNLPAAQKWSPPRYQDIRATEVGLLASADGGALVRVIAGELAGHAGPGSTYTPMTFLHATLSPEAELVLPWRADHNALVYVLAGHGSVGAERIPVETGQLAVLGVGNVVRLAAEARQESRSPNLDVLVLGGQRIGEPVAWAGPFVMNTRDEVQQAFADYQAGRLGSIPAVHGAPTELTES